MTVVTVGVHIVDVLARPVESIPAGQDTHLLEQIRITAAGAAAARPWPWRSSACRSPRRAPSATTSWATSS